MDDSSRSEPSIQAGAGQGPREEAEPAASRHHRATPLVERVYQGLRTRIEGGTYRPDQRLPGEHELAQQFQVSRPIVRDALALLREEELIHSRRGAGSFVRVRPGEVSRVLLGFAPIETIADIQRFYEFRISIEPDYAHYAALRWNPPALQAIGAALDQMKMATEASLHREDADFAFHSAIAAAANNHYYLSSYQALKGHVGVGMKFHGASLMGPEGGLSGVFEEHRRIFDAIRDRDGARASAEMRRHLEGSRDRVFEKRLLDLAL